MAVSGGQFVGGVTAPESKLGSFSDYLAEVNAAKLTLLTARIEPLIAQYGEQWVQQNAPELFQEWLRLGRQTPGTAAPATSAQMFESGAFDMARRLSQQVPTESPSVAPTAAPASASPIIPASQQAGITSGVPGVPTVRPAVVPAQVPAPAESTGVQVPRAETQGSGVQLTAYPWFRDALSQFVADASGSVVLGAAEGGVGSDAYLQAFSAWAARKGYNQEQILMAQEGLRALSREGVSHQEIAQGSERVSRVSSALESQYQSTPPGYEERTESALPTAERQAMTEAARSQVAQDIVSAWENNPYRRMAREGLIPADQAERLATVDPNGLRAAELERSLRGATGVQGVQGVQGSPTSVPASTPPTTPVAPATAATPVLAPGATPEARIVYVDALYGSEDYQSLLSRITEDANRLRAQDGTLAPEVAVARALNTLSPGMQSLMKGRLANLSEEQQVAASQSAAATLAQEGNLVLGRLASEAPQQLHLLREQIIQDGVNLLSGKSRTYAKSLSDGRLFVDTGMSPDVGSELVAGIGEITGNTQQAWRTISDALEGTNIGKIISKLADEPSTENVQALAKSSFATTIRNERGTGWMRDVAQTEAEKFFAYMNDNWDNPDFEVMIDTLIPSKREHQSLLRKMRSEIRVNETEARIAEETASGLIERVNALNKEDTKISNDRLNWLRMVMEMDLMYAQAAEAMSRASVIANPEASGYMDPEVFKGLVSISSLMDKVEDMPADTRTEALTLFQNVFTTLNSMVTGDTARTGRYTYQGRFLGFLGPERFEFNEGSGLNPFGIDNLYSDEGRAFAEGLGLGK